MIRVNAADGATFSFDMRASDDVRAFEERCRDRVWLASVTAVSIHRDGASHTIATPAGARVSALEAEESERGERVRLFAGELALSMMAHARHRAVRFAVEPVGRHVFRSR